MSSAPGISQRKYSARAFVREEMRCPHCRRELRQPVEACPACGFHLALCEKAFPFRPPPLSLLIDPSGLLPGEVAGQLDRPYRRFRKRFPQVGLSFCVLQLHPDLSLPDFTFWLHNSAPHADDQRAWTILVVCDLSTGRLTASPGFAVEPFLRNSFLEAALNELAACIAENAWLEGLSGFIKECSKYLEQTWTTANERRRRIDARSRRRKKAAS